MPARFPSNRTLRTMQRDLHFAQRTVGDVSAARRGVLAQRIARRIITRNLFRAFR